VGNAQGVELLPNMGRDVLAVGGSAIRGVVMRVVEIEGAE